MDVCMFFACIFYVIIIIHLLSGAIY